MASKPEPSGMRSVVWNHFTVSIADESKTICNHCKSLLSRGGKNPKTYGTTNLLKHLRLNHEAEYSTLQAEEEATQTKGKDKFVGVQQKLDGFVQKVTRLDLIIQQGTEDY